MTRTNKSLVIIGAVMAILDIYFNTFLVARLYELSTNPTNVIARYYIIVYITIAVTFILLGKTIKKHAIAVLRTGVFFNAIVLILIMILDSNVERHYSIIALIFGLAQGCYYSPYSTLVSVSTTRGKGCVKEFYTTSTILSNVVSILFPITIGAYLNIASFKQMSMFILSLIVIQILCTIFIKAEISSEKFSLKSFWNKLMHSSCKKKVIEYYKVSFCNGIISSVLDRTITILILMLYQTTFSLGVLTTVFALSTIVITWGIKHFYNKKYVKVSIVLSALIPTIVVIIFALNVNQITFILYKLVSAVFVCVLLTLTGYARYECLDQKEFEGFDAEHQAACELSLAAGRISGFVGLLICSNLFVDIEAIKVFLIIIGICLIFYARNLFKLYEE